MKRLIIILFVAGFLLLLAALFFRPVVKILSYKQLESIFVEGEVSVGRCDFGLASGLGLSDIEIKKQGVYDIKLKKAVLKILPLRVSLVEPAIIINAPTEPARALIKYLNLGKGAPLILKSAEIFGMSLDLNTADLSVEAIVDTRLNLSARSIDYLNLKMSSFSMRGAQAEDCAVEFGHRPQQGQFSVSLLKYDKLTLTKIEGNLKLENNLLSAYGVTAEALSGTLEFDLGLELGQEPRYSVGMRCAGLDIEKFIQDFNLREKFSMTGKLSGNLKLNGKTGTMEILQGSFSSLAPGGTLVIRDTGFLENIARGAHQGVSVLVETFKDYRYTTGVISAGLEGDSILLKINLEGDTGKRDFDLILHNFKLT